MRGRGREMTLSFPPFTRAVIWLLGINTAVFIALEAFGTTAVIRWVMLYLGLVPNMTVFHFFIWQIVTYSFIHLDSGIGLGTCWGFGCSARRLRVPGACAGSLSLFFRV